MQNRMTQNRMTQNGMTRPGVHGLTLRREARLMMVLQLLALVAAPWTTCRGGPPMFLYVVYLPILVHSKWIECSLLQELGLTWNFSGELRPVFRVHHWHLGARGLADGWSRSSAGCYVRAGSHETVGSVFQTVVGLALGSYCEDPAAVGRAGPGPDSGRPDAAGVRQAGCWFCKVCPRCKFPSGRHGRHGGRGRLLREGAPEGCHR